ncbi:HAD-like domain-containing protein [Kockiozyma suomiensis]|uniref:HAD-like domain-containing protein n=1 Tax=Kockiozyma suomiensis TaxID=1337062 RepID=UPI00334427D4
MSEKAYPVSVKVDAILFDLDGTLVDSTPAVEAGWKQFGKENGVSPELILATSHGRRVYDTLLEHTPHLANDADVERLETTICRDFGSLAVEIPGAKKALADLDFIHQVAASENGKKRKWGIVTSGTYLLASSWLSQFGIPIPEIFVTAERVKSGKPDPEGYLLGRTLLNADSKEGKDVIVFEDAPAGIRAGKAAGATVIGITSTHSKEAVEEAGADYVIADLTYVKVGSISDDGSFVIEILKEVDF